MSTSRCLICSSDKDLQSCNGNIVCKNCLAQQREMDKGFVKPKAYPECDEIIPGKLYLGNNDFARDINLLQSKHITHIICIGNDNQKYFEKNFVYLAVPLNDFEEESITPYLDECINFINAEGAVVFVHCNAGVSRSPAIVIGYLIKWMKMSFNEAFEMVKRKRGIIKPNNGFMEELKKLK